MVDPVLDECCFCRVTDELAILGDFRVIGEVHDTKRHVIESNLICRILQLTVSVNFLNCHLIHG